MNHVGKEVSVRILRSAISLTLALVFLGVGVFVPPILNGISKIGGFLTWVVFILGGGILLVRALFDALILGDKAIGLLLKRLGVREQRSRRRIYKNLAYIVAVILAAAAIYPLFSHLGNLGYSLQLLTIYGALGAVFLFVYDIGRTIYRIAEEKANSVADWLVQTRSKEAD